MIFELASAPLWGHAVAATRRTFDPRRRRAVAASPVSRTQALGPARLHGALPAVVTREIKKGRVAALLGLELG